MRPSFRSRFLRTALLALACLSAFIPRAAWADLVQIELRLPPGRAAHSFAVTSSGNPSGTSAGQGALVLDGAAYLSLTLGYDEAEPPLTLLDSSASESLALNGVAADAVLSLQGMVWTSGAGQARQYFLLPAALAAHELALAEADGTTYPVSTGAVVVVNPAAGGPGIEMVEVSALFDPGAEFWLIDLTAKKRSPSWETWLPASSWVPDYGLYPLVAVRVHVDAHEQGHIFTVHSRAQGGPEICQAVTAGEVEWWEQGDNGNWYEVPGGRSVLSFSVGAGMEFRLTREADNASAPLSADPPWVAEVVSGAPWTWNAYGFFPDPPVRTTIGVTFRVNYDTRGGHQFSARQSDGYIMNWFTPSFATEAIASWDDEGVTNALTVAMLATQVDPAKLWWLRDETTGEDFPLGQLNVLDGWVPQHSVPPPAPTVTFRLPIWRHPGYVTLSPSYSIYGGGLWGYPATSPTSELFYGTDGMEDFSIETFSVDYPNPRPYETQFTLFDGLTGQSTLALGPVSDLRLWLAPPQTLTLTISTSRWDHELLVRHPEGTGYLATKHQTQGGVWFDPSGTAWQTSYYYFDAEANHHPELPWYMEDASTGERIGPNPSNADLINWIAVVAPSALSLVAKFPTAISLRWLVGTAASGGSFEVERRIGATASWSVIHVLAVADAGTEPGYGHYTDTTSSSGIAYQYRVRNSFGGIHSAPSNVLSVTTPGDSDGDGLADDWELQFSPSLATLGGLGGADYDGDGVSDLAEYLANTDPTTAAPALTILAPGGATLTQ